ncbi:glycosyltransferase family 4 protein [Horticoccus luteus]|uniref:Glycosyltransferase family 4 protein n=1 Tax=Horticoccus luteus TaxID=2862869 RepID=A0A8F9XH57_9BACT|nr:glycosyltransferase family 4 protein [Horticoccus luteus]QYM79942.1 glycosyltransferase family 4 protein [Horticoccus luteus]
MPVDALPPIFLLTHEFHPVRGGIATFAEEMARAAADSGRSVEVWAQAAPAEREPVWPFPVRRLSLKGSQDFVCQARLAWELVWHRRRLRRGILFLPEPGPMLAMMALQFFGGIRPHRLVLTFHGSEILQFHRKPITRWLTRRLIRQADRVSTLSRYTRELLVSRFPEAAHKTCLTPGALRSASERTAAVPTARESGHIVVLTVGRLHPRKGQLLTLRALAALPPATRARLEYWIVGGQSKRGYENLLRAEAAQSGLTVRFFGSVPDAELENLYRQADIFALTSVDHGDSVEGFGLVYLEAAGHGLPIVGHAIGGVPEAVVPDVTGFLVRPGDSLSLTAAFARLIDDEGLRAQFAAAGRGWAHRNTWRRSAELLFNDLS